MTIEFSKTVSAGRSLSLTEIPMVTAEAGRTQIMRVTDEAG